MAEYEASYDEICNNDLGLVMFPGHWNITQATTLCKNVKGEINVIKNANNTAQMKELVDKSDVCRNTQRGEPVDSGKCSNFKLM